MSLWSDSSSSHSFSMSDDLLSCAPDYGRDISVFESRNCSGEDGSHRVHCVDNKCFIISREMGNNALQESSNSALSLSAFLFQNQTSLLDAAPLRDTVLHLDCGHGFCGMAALQLGYYSVIFADVNSDLLKDVVWPNIVLNCDDQVSNARCVVSSNWVALSEYLSEPGEHNRAPVTYCPIGLVLVTISTTLNEHTWEKLHSLLLRHLTATGMALVGLHTAISADTPLPVPPYLRLCFEHALLQSPACEGTHLCDIVRITRRV